MSYMVIFGVKESGEVEPQWDLHNSWLGCALVWEALGKKYLGDGHLPNWPKVWELQHSPKPTLDEWWVLMTTFDNCIVHREFFGFCRQMFTDFHKKYGGHWAQCAEAISRLEADGYVGYCINATTVNSNPWTKPVGDPELGELRPYNTNTDKGHWFLSPADRDIHYPAPAPTGTPLGQEKTS